MNRRQFIATGGVGAAALTAGGCWENEQPDSLRIAAEIPSVITTAGGFKGLYLVFEGLCLFAVPQGNGGGQIDVGLLKGAHVPTLRLPRGCLLRVTGEDKAATPSTIGYHHIEYALSGHSITFEPEASAPNLTWSWTNDPRKGCPKDGKQDWRDLRWALDVSKDFGVPATLLADWLKPAHSAAQVALTRGDVESYIDKFAYHPVIEKFAAVMKDADSTTKPIKAAIGYRLDVDAPIKIRLTAADTTSTVIRINGKNQLVTGNVTNFREELMPKPKEGDPLTETEHFRHVLDFGGKSPGYPVWWKTDEASMCNRQASIECGCCPPGVIRRS